MKRTQIQLDEATYEALRRQAHEERRSVAALVRDALQRSAPGQQRQARRSDFRFVGIGRSPRPRHPVSVDHDAALAEAVTTSRPRRRK